MTGTVLLGEESRPWKSELSSNIALRIDRMGTLLVYLHVEGSYPQLLSALQRPRSCVSYI